MAIQPGNKDRLEIRIGSVSGFDSIVSNIVSLPFIFAFLLDLVVLSLETTFYFVQVIIELDEGLVQCHSVFFYFVEFTPLRSLSHVIWNIVVLARSSSFRSIMD